MKMTVVTYEEFGARGDGKTNDLQALRKAHAFANEQGLPVRAKPGASYYLGGQKGKVIIQTDTDFGTAAFLLDDREVEDRKEHVFEVRSRRKPVRLENVPPFRRGQKQLQITLPAPCLVVAENDRVKHFIRRGLNQNRGTAQKDVFLIAEDGTVDPQTPVSWDFDAVTSFTAYPVDPEPLILRGGRFTTIANAAESKYTYYARGIEINRSNVTVEGLEHRITGEGPQGAPYHGFLRINTAAGVTVRDCVLSGHKTYRTIGSAGKPVSMGSYDISVAHSVNVGFENCRQFNDIHDRTYWGIMASNFSRNLVYDGCTFSRFDAHQGVVNATIRRSRLGHMGIQAIGKGILTVEDSRVQSHSFINFRPDYGSTWEGEVVIRNSVFVPEDRSSRTLSLITGRNDGQHDFGYPCFMPSRITIQGLHIEDADFPEGYRGPAVLGDFNPDDDGEEKPFPQVKTREVHLRRITTASGKPLLLSPHPEMFRGVQVDSAEESEQ